MEDVTGSSHHDFVLPPYKHQAQEFERHRDDAARAMLWQMRSGKTKAVIDQVCYNAAGCRLDGALITAPNGVHVNWLRRELPKHHWHGVPHRKLAWHSTRSRTKTWQAQFEELLRYDGLAWFAVNCDALMTERGRAAVARFLKARSGVFLTVDESHEFGTPGAKRTKALRVIAKSPLIEMRRILSGTAVAESPLKAYSQYEVLEPGALGFTRYADFKDRYAIEVERKNSKQQKFKVIEGYRNLEELRERMAQWSSVVLRSDCDDMPELATGERTFDMTAAQLKVFQGLIDGMMQRLDGGEYVSPVEGGVLAIRLLQVSSGYAVDEDGELHWLVAPKDNPRLGALMATLGEVRGKTIVWCKFRPELAMVAEALRAANVGFVEYHGGVRQADRDDAIDAFQGDDRVRVFLGQPGAGGQGLDLSAADDVVWFSHTHRAIERQQADERATQVGGKTIGVTNLVANEGRDHWVLECQAQKADVEDRLAGTGLRDFLEAR